MSQQLIVKGKPLKCTCGADIWSILTDEEGEMTCCECDNCGRDIA